jgi:hypothetical protein
MNGIDSRAVGVIVKTLVAAGIVALAWWLSCSTFSG